MLRHVWCLAPFLCRVPLSPFFKGFPPSGVTIGVLLLIPSMVSRTLFFSTPVCCRLPICHFFGFPNTPQCLKIVVFSLLSHIWTLPCVFPPVLLCFLVLISLARGDTQLSCDNPSCPPKCANFVQRFGELPWDFKNTSRSSRPLCAVNYLS